MKWAYVVAFQLALTCAGAQSLDFKFYRTRVEPIFLKKRPGHARCYGCHILPNRVFHLATLSPSATDWSEEESRQNFESIQRLVVPGNPEASPFLFLPSPLVGEGQHFAPRRPIR